MLNGRLVPPDFHSLANAAIRRAVHAGGPSAGRATARRLFEQQIVLADPAEAARQLAAGVCERISAPAELLRRCRAEDAFAWTPEASPERAGAAVHSERTTAERDRG